MGCSGHKAHSLNSHLMVHAYSAQRADRSAAFLAVKRIQKVAKAWLLSYCDRSLLVSAAFAIFILLTKAVEAHVGISLTVVCNCNMNLRTKLIVANTLILSAEIVTLLLIKSNYIRSNFGLEVLFNVVFYGSIILLQTLLLILAIKMKYGSTQNNILAVLIIIFPAIFILILSELNVI